MALCAWGDEYADAGVGEVEANEVAPVGCFVSACYAEGSLCPSDEHCAGGGAGGLDGGAANPAVVGFTSEGVSHFDVVAHVGPQ